MGETGRYLMMLCCRWIGGKREKGNNMDDLEITRRCADKMGLHSEFGYDPVTKSAVYIFVWTADGNAFDPLRNDAQAMALVKRRMLACEKSIFSNVWIVSENRAAIRKYGKEPVTAESADLNRAICLCVANLPESCRRTKPQSSAPA